MGSRQSISRMGVRAVALTIPILAVTAAAAAVQQQTPEWYRGDAATEAERSAGGKPASPGVRPGRVVRLPEPRAAERNDPGAGQPETAVREIGFGRDLSMIGLNPVDQGDLVWHSLSNGGQAAAVSIVSPGAAALRAELVFRALPDGVEVRVYAGSEEAGSGWPAPLPEDIRAKVSAEGSYSMWTPTVTGESLTIEFFLPRGARRAGLTVSIPLISHIEIDPPRPC